MTNEPARLVPVETRLVLQTLVESVFAKAEERTGERLPRSIAGVLDAPGQGLAGDNDPALDRDLRHAGYHARVVETELFEPARRRAEWIPQALAERHARTGSWRQAMTETCAEIARAEPIGKPSPDDELAMSWRVPGPGGHVRHHLARRAIEERLRELDGPVDGDPAELKRPWLYGFFVRACEEALPEHAVLDTEG